LGRWDKNDRPSRGGWGRIIGGGNTNRIRTTKRLLIIGLVVVVAIVLTIIFSRGGIYIDIIEREEGMGTLQTLIVRVSNNNFNSFNGVTVQFGEDGKVQTIGDMGAFSSVTITPPPEDMDFENIIVRANNGQVQVVKSR
jgi:hypothetical protein